MKGPALAHTTCPGCGAPIRIDVWAAVHTCRFCRQSSFVHRPNRPVLPPPPGQEHFGHIHVTSSAVNRSLALLVALVVVGLNLVGAAITVLVIGIGALGAAVGSRPTAPSPKVTVVTPSQPLPVNVPSGALGPSCQKAIRCCKTIQPQNAGCDAMGMLGEVECARQAKTFEDAARAMNRRCE